MHNVGTHNPATGSQRKFVMATLVSETNPGLHVYVAIYQVSLRQRTLCHPCSPANKPCSQVYKRNRFGRLFPFVVQNKNIIGSPVGLLSACANWRACACASSILIGQPSILICIATTVTMRVAMTNTSNCLGCSTTTCWTCVGVMFKLG